jgi:predicted membrane protein
MTNDIEQQKNPRNGKALAGIVLLVVGMVLLIHQFDFFFFPHWLFTWPMWLIFWGLFIGARSNFHKPGSFILLGLGVVFLFTENLHNSGDVVWPLFIIAFGLWMILRRHNPYDKDKQYWNAKYGHKWDWRAQTGTNPNNPPVSDATYTEVPPQGSSSSSFRPSGDDYIDAVSVFGGIKKVVLSKDFKCGDIVNIFGGAELDFMQADINGRVFIDITQIFGGVKIIVPSNWQVVSDIAAVFASVDDKRIKTAAGLSSDKILVLKGVSMFAGIDIRSY